MRHRPAEYPHGCALQQFLQVHEAAPDVAQVCQGVSGGTRVPKPVRGGLVGVWRNGLRTSTVSSAPILLPMRLLLAPTPAPPSHPEMFPPEVPRISKDHNQLLVQTTKLGSRPQSLGAPELPS